MKTSKTSPLTQGLLAAALIAGLGLSACTPPPPPAPASVSAQDVQAAPYPSQDVVVDELGEGVYDLASVHTKRISKITIQTKANLNLRRSATASSKRLITLPKGTKVTSTQRASNGWYKVTYKNRSGWVSGRYVKTVKASHKVVRHGDRWAKSNQPYYASATSMKVIGHLKKGQRYWFSRWHKKQRRDQISVAGRWVWAGPMHTKAPKKPSSSKPRPGVPAKAKLKVGYNQSYAGLTYSVLDGGVNRSRAQGVMIYLDGDYYPGYGGAVSNAASGAKAKAMAKSAAKANMYLAIPKLPKAGYTKALGYTWWG